MAKHFRAKPILLDCFHAVDVYRTAAIRDKCLRYHSELYNALAIERDKISDCLKKALLEAAIGPFKFSGWQRLVKYRYSDNPLSPEGSLLEPGGRFNIPDINPLRFPRFPALYIAEDRKTALGEALGGEGDGAMSALDCALVKRESIAVISLEGELDSVIDLNKAERLEPFLRLIAGISLPAEKEKLLADMGKAAEIEPMQLVRTMDELANALFAGEWRRMPMLYDIPAQCQVFGQLVFNAGIDGIVYPSRVSPGNCIAIYPRNLIPGSYVQLSGAVPASLKITRLDRVSWPAMRGTLDY
ncbi:MAG: RES family NAD+ phosphorylase [Elusimicrobiales bacterium]